MCASYLTVLHSERGGGAQRRRGRARHAHAGGQAGGPEIRLQLTAVVCQGLTAVMRAGSTAVVGKVLVRGVVDL
jgi:hypothetical protein